MSKSPQNCQKLHKDERKHEWKVAKSGWNMLKVATDCQKIPKVDKDDQKVDQSGRKLMTVAKRSHRLLKFDKIGQNMEKLPKDRKVFNG